MATFIRVTARTGARFVNLDQVVSLPVPPDEVTEHTILTIVTTAVVTAIDGLSYYDIDIVGTAAVEAYRAELRRVGVLVNAPAAPQLHILDDDE